ncbi:hypothetical protein A3K69_03705 [Candidatus Bathyarchaeota archaeon RBG_16_57_9]|nr:MAG: hypothetical protein A3K69_03705 [Candidatus Bathyarchaeota archaeon RBG_16_57_9]
MEEKPFFTVRNLAPPLGLALANILLAAAAYGSLPERIIIHWNAAGSPDGYSGRIGIVLMPLASLMFLGLFLLIPRIDPTGNIGRFGGTYVGLMSMLQLYVLFLSGVFIAQNLGYTFNVVAALALAIGPLLYYIGMVLGKAELNWFVGIRTPWTLSDEEVWGKTHQMGGRLFKACGAVALLGALLPDIGIWLMILPLGLSCLYLVWYSYAEYQRKRR